MCEFIRKKWFLIKQEFAFYPIASLNRFAALERVVP